jgi:acyl carrier protein
MTREEIKTKARATLARTLKTEPEKISDDASQSDLASWDSVKHMNVVLALENDFGIEFGDAELPKLTSLPKLVDAIERRLQE